MVESCGNAQTRQFRNSELRGRRGFIVQAGRLIEASAQELTLTILVKTPQICGQMGWRFKHFVFRNQSVISPFCVEHPRAVFLRNLDSWRAQKKFFSRSLAAV